MAVATHRPLPSEIRAIQDEMEAIAASYGLDFFPTIFEFLDYDELSMFAAYGGFPSRYPHWRFGAEFDELMKGYTYGLQKIYEMVINTDPCYAYLLSCNSIMDQKLVIAHVYGHCDFFKNNAFFAHTNRKMLDQMANHASRVNRYIDRFGYEVVEQFIDACLSLENLIDPHSVAVRRRPVDRAEPLEGDEPKSDGKFRSKDYMDPYINPPQVLEAEAEAKKAEAAAKAAVRRFPEEPQRDVLLFLLEHAPLRAWQYDVLSIIRDEAYYFAPQGQTKIMNEGWACVTGDTLVRTDRGLIPMSGVVEATHAGESLSVYDGDAYRAVTDCHVIEDHATVTVQTSLGLRLNGSNNHRVMLEDGTWRQLDELELGDALRLPTPLADETTEDAIDAEAALTVEQASLLGWMSKQVCLPVRVEGRDVGFFIAQESVWGEAERWDSAIGCVPRTAIAVGVHGSSEQTFDVGKPIDKAPQKMGTRARLRYNGLFLSLDELPEATAPLVPHLVAENRSESNSTWTPNNPVGPLVQALLASNRAAVVGFLNGMLLGDETKLNVGTKANRTKYLKEHSQFGVNDLQFNRPEILEAVHLRLIEEGVVCRRRVASQSGPRVAGDLRFSAEATRRLVANGVLNGLLIEEAVDEFLNDPQADERRPETPNNVAEVTQSRDDVYDITVEETHRYAAAGFINHNSYWHSTIMTKHGLTDAEVIDYADHHSGTMAMSPTRLNPYKIGIELFRDIEERWDKGQFGPEWDACDDLQAKKSWNKELGQGRDKIFEVRRVHNDVTFIDTFLNEDFCRRHKLFSFAYNERSGDYEIASREFQAIKQQLLTSLTNHGRPFIYVTDGNHENRGELYLKHDYAGIELQGDEARATLVNLHKLWTRPVHIETVVDDMKTVMSFGGSDHAVTVVG